MKNNYPMSPNLTRSDMTRDELRGIIDPELITDMSKKPIKPMKVGNLIYPPEAAWKMIMLQTVFPFCRLQIRYLKHHKHLLSDDENRIAENYAEMFRQYESDWRSKPFSFPPQPEEFVNILLPQN